MNSKSSWKILYKEKLVCIEENESRSFERAVRPPGVRALLYNDKGLILLTREFRHETNSFDYRLTGGKVFDDLDWYLNIRNNTELLTEVAFNAVVIECKQEAGIDKISDLNLIHISKDGTTIEWDLYYFSGTIESMSEQDLQNDEKDGIQVNFYTRIQILEMLNAKLVKEDRTRAILYQELLK